MAQGSLWFQPIQHIFSSSGVNVAGAKAYFYLAGTTTAVAVYTDVGLTTPAAVPVVADGNGIFSEIFLTPGVAYKVDVQTSAGVSLTGYPADNQLAIPLSASNVSFNGTFGETVTAGTGVYLSDGSGAKNAGQWYKWDSANTYSSSTPEIGIAPSAVTSGLSGAIQQAGQVTGLSGLAVGSAYYVGTAGALTLTATSRFVGHADSTTSLILPDSNPKLGTATDNGVVEGRLTLTTAVPVTTTDVSAATIAYFTPYRGNRIALYDGANWNMRTFSEITISLVGLTASKPYDIFAFDNAGVVTIETLVWTSQTSRATALVTQDGVLSKTGVLTRRYIGTIYINASGGQSDDTLAKRYIFNYMNRVPRPLARMESTATPWTYTTAAFRQVNGAAANQIEVMNGVPDYQLLLTITSTVSNSVGGAAVQLAAGIGEDVTNAAIGGTVNTIAQVSGVGANYLSQLVASLSKIPPNGYHFYSWLEYSTATGTTSWYSGTTNINSGMAGTWWA